MTGRHAHPLRARSASAFVETTARQAAQAHPFGAGSRLHGLMTSIHEISGLAEPVFSGPGFSLTHLGRFSILPVKHENRRTVP
jgi:hypothetical protein